MYGRAIMTRQAFENALRVMMAIGGSTNAVIHLLAIAGRLRVPLTLDDFDRFAATTPLLLDLQPSGAGLMGDFDTAGGLPSLLYELRDVLHLESTGVSGRPLGEHVPDERGRNAGRGPAARRSTARRAGPRRAAR